MIIYLDLSTSDVLMQVIIPVQEESYCRGLAVLPDITTQICAGDKNSLKDTCGVEWI